MSLELQFGARPSALALLCKSLDLVSADTVARALPSSRIVFSAADGAEPPSLVSLSLGALLGAVLGVFLLGGGVGYVVGRRRREEGARETSTIAVCRKEAQKCDEGGLGEASSDEDGPTMVLKGSLDLLSSKWGDRRAQKSSAVVEYLSPEEMSRLLFARMDEAGDGASQTLSLEEGDEDELVASPKSSTADIAGLLSKAQLRHVFGSKSRHEPMTPQAFLRLLSLIQKYSVDTSHPYFFNQLFGSLDPIALAAEIVALSVNTSVYTYETAPVFTLLEREVMGQIGRLVFAKTAESEGCEEEEEEEFEGEGLMIPGGSLANLTAMHAARHRWRAVNGYLSQQTKKQSVDTAEDAHWSPPEKEKKLEDVSLHGPSSPSLEEGPVETLYDCDRSTPDLVAFVSSEAHYSFSKSARVLGMREDDLIVIPTHADGRMNVEVLAKRIEELESDTLSEQNGQTAEGLRKRVPFFVACTAGSTVRGSFDEIATIVKVCRGYESRGPPSQSSGDTRSIWVHVDGAWGGSAIFSARPSIRASTHMDEIRHADSFTFNPHKMLGAPQQTTAFIVRHRNALRNANAAGARYLFDPRKNGAAYDLGDLSYTCGRRTDAVKLWALWKYYGRIGLGQRVDCKVDQLEVFVAEMKKRKGRFALACKPWPFNVNFFYFPPRIRAVLEARGVFGVLGGGNDEYVQIPDDIAEDLANVSVTLKLRLHEAGEMIIPYQPLNNQKADCFRLVLAGRKDFGIEDIRHVLDTMENYGKDL
ncbi:hypothetical protein ACHAXT_005136 [Thalassiosira profunda]